MTEPVTWLVPSDFQNHNNMQKLDAVCVFGPQFFYHSIITVKRLMSWALFFGIAERETKSKQGRLGCAWMKERNWKKGS